MTRRCSTWPTGCSSSATGHWLPPSADRTERPVPRYRWAVTDVVALIPAFEEGPRVGAVVLRATAHLPVLVVDDGSTDDTAARAQAAGATRRGPAPEPGQGCGAASRFRLGARPRRGSGGHPRRRRAARSRRDPDVPRRVRPDRGRPGHRSARFQPDAARSPAVQPARRAGDCRGPPAATCPTTSRATGSSAGA